MGSLQQEIEEHGVWNTLDELKVRLDEIGGDAGAEADANQYELLSRIERIVAEAKRRLTSVDAILLSPVLLAPVNDSATPLLTELKNFSPEDSTPLANANTSATNLLGSLVALPYVTPSDAEALGDSVSSFRRSIGQHARRATDELDDLEAKIAQATAQAEKLSSEQESQKTRLDSLILNTQTQASDGETKRTGALQSALTEANERTEAKLKEINDESAAALASFKEKQLAALEALRLEHAKEEQEWQDALKGLKSEFAELASDANEAAIEQREFQRLEAQELIEKLEAQKAKAVELVGIVANTSMAGGYKLVADEHAEATKHWNSVTVLAIVGLLGFAILTFETTAPFEWGTFLRKALVTLPFVLLVAYAAQQATRNHSLGTKSRRNQLEFASLDPFLATLDAEKRDEIKMALAVKMFGAPEPQPAEAQPFVVKGLLDVLGKAVNK